jgi:hypothetical protein
VALAARQSLALLGRLGLVLASGACAALREVAIDPSARDGTFTRLARARCSRGAPFALRATSALACPL